MEKQAINKIETREKAVIDNLPEKGLPLPDVKQNEPKDDKHNPPPTDNWHPDQPI